jgi:hypothetical protein
MRNEKGKGKREERGNREQGIMNREQGTRRSEELGMSRRGQGRDVIRHLPLFTLLFSLFSLFLFSCNSIFDLPKPEKAVGQGYFSLSIGEPGAARTIMPEIVEDGFALYELNFYSQGGPGNPGGYWSEVRTKDNLFQPIRLNEGTWNLYVYAYMDEYSGIPSAQGELRNIVISAERPETGNVTLTPIDDGKGEGTFSWDIGLPSITFSEAIMTITRLPAYPGDWPYATIPLGGTNVPPGAGPSGSTDLPTGYYSVVIKLKTDEGKEAERQEVLHVYQNMESAFEYTFLESQLYFVLTGSVFITGTPEVGETLTANTNNLGGSGNNILYQWKRGGTAIGTNSGTYIAQSADVSYAITVTVTRDGYVGIVTSAPTAAISDPTLPILGGTVSISTGTGTGPRQVTVEMWSNGTNGWNGGGLGIDVNGNFASSIVNPIVGKSPDYYTFTVNTGDVVAFYWIQGSPYDNSGCAFAVYYSDDPPNPDFYPSINNWSPSYDPDGKVLLYRQYYSINDITGAPMGSFTAGTTPIVGQTLTAITSILNLTGNPDML